MLRNATITSVLRGIEDEQQADSFNFKVNQAGFFMKPAVRTMVIFVIMSLLYWVHFALVRVKAKVPFCLYGMPCISYY